MVDEILKYRSGNLIILYHYILWIVRYYRVVVWNSIKLIRSIESSSEIDR